MEREDPGATGDPDAPEHGQRPSFEETVPRVEAAIPVEPPPEEQPPAPLPRTRRAALPAAARAAVLLLAAVALFAAGLATQAILDGGTDLSSLELRLQALDQRTGGIEQDLGDLLLAVTGETRPVEMVAAADDPTWGPQDAPVTIHIFADFQCPYCGHFATETLPRLKEAYADRVLFIYRDFPLTGHQFALQAAEAAQCAHEQGGFWQYHDLLFQRQHALDVEHLKQYAAEAGLDSAAFSTCLGSGQSRQEVVLDVQDGRNAGVSGTPAFLINGEMVTGAQPFEQFQVVIERALAAP